MSKHQLHPKQLEFVQEVLKLAQFIERETPLPSTEALILASFMHLDNRLTDILCLLISGDDAEEEEGGTAD